MTDTFDIWIRRLRDSEVAVRQEAIRHLEALGNPAALGPLATVFALDTDLPTRKMAQWAGKSIYAIVERRANISTEASAEERQRAAEILAKINNNKKSKRR